MNDWEDWIWLDVLTVRATQTMDLLKPIILSVELMIVLLSWAEGQPHPDLYMVVRNCK